VKNNKNTRNSRNTVLLLLLYSLYDDLISTEFIKYIRISGRVCFSTLTLLVGRQKGHPVCEWWGTGVVICLEWGADLHMAQLMPPPLTVASVKSRLVLPFWYRLTRVVPEKGPLNGCVRGRVCCLSVAVRWTGSMMRSTASASLKLEHGRAE